MYNTILKRFVYILKNFVDCYEFSVNIEPMGEFCIGMKIVYSISIEKLLWV